jgi:hypothetical protein
MLKFRAVPRRLFSYGKPSMVEDWETTLAPEKFTKSFQEYLDSRLTLDDMMKSKEVIRLATMKLDGRMFYSEEDGRWHLLKEKKSPNSNDTDPEPVCDP